MAEWQVAMGAREFIRWKVHFEQESTATKHADYYLAQIACEVRRGNMKDPRKVSLHDFLLKFTIGGSAAATPLNKEARIQNSKNFWLGLVNFFGNRTKAPPQKKDN